MFLKKHVFENMGKIAMQGTFLRFVETRPPTYAIDIRSMEIRSDLREQQVKTFSENMFLKNKKQSMNEP
ncbi:MAG: hypothetical protein GY820_20460 [Gammaproteobacteria bacterium]|nr:hypothetical protein [Gammaproteobacteria bacterium]